MVQIIIVEMCENTEDQYLVIFYIIKVTVCVCLFSIEIQTAGRIGTKFGTEVVLEGGGRFLSLNTFFNTYFESSRATPGNPS